jgi:UDP-2,4-diacetamido-2,4,6-trideoxy-beta-L-altropyranose hydrolase
VNFAFRADASFEIGTGHVLRCLALAEALRSGGARVAFVCRPLPENLAMLIRQTGIELCTIGECPAGGAEDARLSRQALSRQPNWLVVDNYAIAEPWENALRSCADRIMVIDDLADRRHDCDLILDQNFYDDLERRYDTLVPPGCTKALGPQFALLRREFYERQPNSRRRDGTVRRVLVSFGGSDPTDETAKVLGALNDEPFRDLRLDVVVGGAAISGEDLKRKAASDPRVRIHQQPPSISALMAEADLCVGAGGIMTWERCFMGLPSVVVETARNQSETARALHRAGAIRNLGWHEEVTAAHVATAVSSLLTDPAAVLRLTDRALAIMAPDGRPSREMRIVKTLTAGHL